MNRRTPAPDTPTPTVARPHRRRAVLASGLALALALSGALFAVAAGDANDDATHDGDVAAVPFTTEQVESGQAAYQQHCAACHAAEMEGMAHFPQLAGPRFRERWSDDTLGDLFVYTRDEMPLGQGGSLPEETYAEIIVAVLAANDVPAGEVAFDPADEDQLALALGPAFGSEE